MAQTSWGFDGTINEAQWSEMAGLLGNGYVAADSASCVVTAVPGARSVSVSAGTLYGDGIVTVLDAAETVAMTTPVNGQWYVIALRRTWASNSTALVAIAGATTSTSTPTAPPSTLPTLNSDPGVLTDQPISWAWCNSANTTVVVYDMRQFPVRRMPLTVASAAVRDGIFQTPTQGQEVWRNDLGAVETYYGLYNASTNPGGRDVAGWYTTDRAGGLVPIRPTTVTIASGSGSANALGQVSFTSATKVSLQGIFSAEYENYLLVITGLATANAFLFSRLIFPNNSEETFTAYGFQGLAASGGTLSGFRTVGAATMEISYLNTSQNFSIKSEIYRPFVSTAVTQLATNEVLGVGASAQIITYNSQYAGQASYTGLSIYPSTGNITGSLQVFGYND